MWGEISDRTKFALDETGRFSPEATTFLMSGKHLAFVVGFLNSSLSEYLFSKIGTTTGVGTVRWKKFKVEQLVVPRFNEQLEQFVVKALHDLSAGAFSASHVRKRLDSEFFRVCKISEEEQKFILTQVSSY